MLLDVGQTQPLSPGKSSGYSGIKDKILGKDDFLKMLVAQLHYQDPMNPMESTDFSAQLAQFSSVEQLENISSNLEAFIDSNYMLTTSINNTLAANIIGKSVKANGNAVYFNGSDPVQIPFHLGSDAQNVKIEIYDSNGNVVRTLTADDLQQGDQYLEWDGTDTNGYQLSKGKYTVKISATDSEGNPVDANTYMMGEVTGIKYTANGAVLLVGELEINFSDVIEILGQTV
jgi:flagellar basal-body rod modification protein FlgD